MSCAETQASSEATNRPSHHGEAEGLPQHKRRRFDRTRKGVRWVLAVDAWKRQFGHLKHRASFPLLRQVVRGEIRQARAIIALEAIPTEVLERSLLSHFFILIFAVPAALWAAYMTTKGLAAGIRFDMWFNGWLLQGVPVLIFCAMKVLTSNQSRQLIQRELAMRAAVGKE